MQTAEYTIYNTISTGNFWINKEWVKLVFNKHKGLDFKDDNTEFLSLPNH